MHSFSLFVILRCEMIHPGADGASVPRSCMAWPLEASGTEGAPAEAKSNRQFSFAFEGAEAGTTLSPFLYR